MTLITSISGIRGTIGGQVGENLTPVDITKFTSAYGSWLKTQNHPAKNNHRWTRRSAQWPLGFKHRLCHITSLRF